MYVTDVQAAGDKAEGVAIDIAGDADLAVVYPMGILQQSTNKDLAQTWIDFVASKDGRAALAARGFLAP